MCVYYRENPKYLGDLGGVLKNLCRVIPDGILMFFTSYPVMQKTIDYWQQEGHWSHISTLKVTTTAADCVLTLDVRRQ